MRVITVVLAIADDEAAKVIWESHRDNKLLNGCLVTAIANDDALEEVEHYETKLDKAMELLARDGIDGAYELEKFCEKLDKKAEKSKPTAEEMQKLKEKLLENKK